MDKVLFIVDFSRKTNPFCIRLRSHWERSCSASVRMSPLSLVLALKRLAFRYINASTAYTFDLFVSPDARQLSRQDGSLHRRVQIVSDHYLSMHYILR